MAKIPHRLAGWLASPRGQLQLLIALAVALGGGGVGFALRNLVIQLAALVLLAIQRERAWCFITQGPRFLVALVLLTLALPLIQLVPLPASLWQALPGREPVQAAFAIAGVAPDSWFPLSLDQGRTLTAFAGLLPAAAIIAIGAHMPREDKAELARFAAFAVLAALGLGIVQLSTANTWGLLFPILPTPKADVLYASFANRNSAAMGFVLALILLAAAPWWKSRAALMLAIGGSVLLALGVVLTQSRSGMVVLLLALGFAGLRAGLAALARQRGKDALPPPLWIGTIVLVGLVLAAFLAATLGGGRPAASLARFADSDTARPQLWEDGAYAAQEYWPVGSGMGTFDEVFQSYESLEYITPRRAGRAHSDVLEVVIEGGIVSTALVLAWLAWCMAAALRAPPWWRWPALGAGAGVLALLAQSLLDYPLRNQTLLALAAVLVVLLAWRKRSA